jgi:hypothetical protein
VHAILALLVGRGKKARATKLCKKRNWGSTIKYRNHGILREVTMWINVRI